MRVAVSGAAGQMGRVVVDAVAEAPDLDLVALFDPPAAGEQIGGLDVSADPDAAADADVVVEFTNPEVVLGNLASWRAIGVNVVVGTSGFDEARIEEARTTWGSGPPNCLIVPNFSIGATLMMRLGQIAAPHFDAAEIIELHHDRKADAPSGTALATAGQIGAAMAQQRHTDSAELVAGARGAAVDGVPVHSVRLPGLVAHQEILLGGTGETLTIRHDTTSRLAFVPGILLAIRSVGTLVDPVSVGLEQLLGID